MIRSNTLIDRIISTCKLPKLFIELLKMGICKKPPLYIAIDLLELFYFYRTFPDNYVSCRLWEKERDEWKFYYGSNYQTYQRASLRREVQPYEYQILFNDKEVCELLCKSMGVRAPHTYDTINPNQNYRKKITECFENTAANTLIIKPILGRAGRGIILAKRDNGKIIIKTTRGVFNLNDFVLTEKSLVQEYLLQDDRMCIFSKFSVNTIRVVTMLTKKGGAIVLSSMMRCGIGDSYVDNVSAGGLAVGVNRETGKLKKYAYDIKGNRHAFHPTTKVIFEDFVIPELKHILETARIIQEYLPFYMILGMDIALGQGAEPVLIELNAAPDIAIQEAIDGPFLKSRAVLEAFGDYDLLINRYQKKLYLNVKKWKLKE